MITIHEENHLYGLRKLSKTARKSGMFRTLDEFKDDILDSFYCDIDCSAYWACLHEEHVYEGNHVSFDRDYMHDSVGWIYWINKPDWATHVMWYSK